MKRSIVIVLALAACESIHYVGDNGRGSGQSGGSGGSAGGGGEMPDASPPITDANMGSGGSGGIGSDANADNCQPYAPPAPNPTGCPPTTPQGLTSCAGLPAGTNCTYEVNHCAIETCTCYPHSTDTDQLWACNGAGFCGMSSLCPATPPGVDSDCSGLVGESCMYLGSGSMGTGYAFSCQPNGTWQCNQFGVPSLPTQLTPRPNGPPGIDESKQVQQLTMAEAQTWCQWYVGDWGFQPGQAPPDDNGQCPGMPGYVCGYAGISVGNSQPYLTGCLERISMSACVANLMLRPCDATVRDLDDCVMSFWDLSNHYVDSGCFPYQTHASCDQTIVQRYYDPTNPGPQSCAIPIQ